MSTGSLVESAHKGSCSLPAMAKQTLGDRIKLARDELKLSQQQLAKAVEITQQTVQELESGRSQTTRKILKFADVLKQDPKWLQDGVGQMRRHHGVVLEPAKFSAGLKDLSTGPLRPVRVVGAVQAGEWVESLEWPLGEQYEMPLPIPQGYRGYAVQALEVRGPSMNEVYPPGSVIVVISFIDLGRDPRHGERVVALRLRPGEFEATVKEFRIDSDGKARLWPRSTHPDFQAPILAEDVDDPEEGLRIAYLVIGSYRPEV